MTDESQKRGSSAAAAKAVQSDAMKTAELVVAPIGELVTPAVEKGGPRQTDARSPAHSRRRNRHCRWKDHLCRTG